MNNKYVQTAPPDVDARKVTQTTREPEGAPKTPPTGVAAIGKTKNLAKNATSTTPGTEDAAGLKPAMLVQNEPLKQPVTAVTRPECKDDTLVIPNVGRMLPLPKAAGELTDRRLVSRRWLETRSKADLIELILSLEDQVPELEITDRLVRAQMVEPSTAPHEGYKIPDGITYHRLPVLRKTPLNEPTPSWQIVLVCLDQSIKPVGLHIDGEITIGRTAGDITPDLDLTPFGATSKGVSRIHARLRPLIDKLMLLDCNSSNGTYWNRLRIPDQTEQPLRDGDMIAFGQATFLVKIAKTPDLKEAKTLI